MAENITVSDIIPARAERVFTAWLDPVEHGKMTGGAATDEGGGRFTAWDGYITGRTISSVPTSKIVQTWRTTEFSEDDPDSLLTVLLEPAEGGTRVTFVHENIPDGQGPAYEGGWKEHYFTPMKAYFRSPGAKVRQVGHAIEHALEEATEQVEHAAEEAMEAVDKARSKAARQAVKAVQSVKKAQKKAAAQLKKTQKKAAAGVKALGKKVKALVTRKPKGKAKAAAKKPARPAPKKKAAAKKKKR